MLALASDVIGVDERLVGVGLGAVQMAAGVLFWPSRDQIAGVRVRGERLLAGLLTLWGLHRIATQFVPAPPGSPAYFCVHAVFITLYFLATFAVIIMVPAPASDKPRYRTLPAFTSSAIAPTVSSIGVLGSTRC